MPDYEGDFSTTFWSPTALNVTYYTEENGSYDPYSIGRDKKLVLFPLILLIVLTCAANIVVMLCTRLDPKLKKAHSNMYVFSLAVADLLVGLTVMTAMSVYTLTGLWPLGDLLCTVWIGFDFTCCTVSMLHLCLIAYDRFQALTQPLKYKSPNRRRQVVICICMSWVGGALAWLPAIIYYRITMEPIPNDCYFVPNLTYLTAQVCLVYYLPILIMSYFYVMCVYGLRVQFQKVEAMTGGAANGGGNTGTSQRSALTDEVSTIPTESLTRPTETGLTELSMGVSGVGAGSTGQTKVKAIPGDVRQRRRQEHMRGIRTLGVIIIIFLFCWMPFCLFWPISAYCETCITAEWYEYSYWAAYLNSFINPYLYFLCNKDFRSALKKLLKRK